MKAKMRALLVDDEYPARKELRTLLSSFPDVEIVGEAARAEEAYQLIQALHYDVLFLDIQMPGVSGMELARRLSGRDETPMVVFTTAFQEHALEAFAVNAVDYLLKPFDEDRLGQALARAARRLVCAQPQPAPKEPPDAKAPEGRVSQGRPAEGELPEGRPSQDGQALADRIPAERANRTVLVDVSDIVFIYAEKEDVYIKLAKERLLTRRTLRDLEEQLKGQGFLRTHRQYLVNLRKVQEVVPYFKGTLCLVVDDAQRTEVPVSRTMVRTVKVKLNLLPR